MHTYLVGASKLFRTGLKQMLDGSPFATVHEFEILEEIYPDLQAGDLVIVQKPDSIDHILDRIAELKADPREPRIVLVASSINPEQLVAAFAAGIDAYILEDISSDVLLDYINLVSRGEKVFPSRLAQLIYGGLWVPATAPPSFPNAEMLSEREMEILHWLANGLPNKTIAHNLSITEATVKGHIKAIMKKHGFSNRTQAAIWAVQKGMTARAPAPPGHPPSPAPNGVMPEADATPQGRHRTPDGSATRSGLPRPELSPQAKTFATSRIILRGARHPLRRRELHGSATLFVSFVASRTPSLPNVHTKVRGIDTNISIALL